METTKVNLNSITKNTFILKPNFHMNFGKRRIEQARKNGLRFESLGNVVDKVFTGGIFKRVFVESSEFGLPYISAQHMMNSNPLDVAKIISKKYTPRQDDMSLKENQILISCAGTVGNVKLITSDLEGVIGSQDIIRVDVDDKLLFGYLYSFLSSQTAYTYMQSFIYGSVVPRIEPNTLKKLPIPILPKEFQQKIHNLIVESAQLRVEANKLLKEATSVFDELKVDYLAGSFVFNKVKIQKISSNKKRFDANYNVISELVDEKLKNIKYVTIRSQSSKIFIGPRSKRNYVATGVPFLSTSEMQKANPTKTEKFVNHKTAKDFAVREGWILTTRSGTLGDTIFVMPVIDNYAVSEDGIRIVVDENSEISNRYLFAFLKSNIGKNSLLAGSYGSVILHLNEDYVGDIKVPVFEEKFEEIERNVSKYIECFNQAIINENQAIDLIEKEIDQWQQ